MANIKSQKKRNLTNAKARRAQQGRQERAEDRASKVAVTAIAEHRRRRARPLRLAQKRLDKAATKGVIHKNQAARRKSRLMKKVNTACDPARLRRACSPERHDGVPDHQLSERLRGMSQRLCERTDDRGSRSLT